jgi:hypothetical protein
VPPGFDVFTAFAAAAPAAPPREDSDAPIGGFFARVAGALGFGGASAASGPPPGDCDDGINDGSRARFAAGSRSSDESPADPFAPPTDLFAASADPFAPTADPFAATRSNMRVGKDGSPPPVSGRDPSTPPPADLEAALEELGKALAEATTALEAGTWPSDGGARVMSLVTAALVSLGRRGLVARAKKTVELLSRTLPALVALLNARRGNPREVADRARAAGEALAAQCRAELAPLLGAGGTFWEASV